MLVTYIFSFSSNVFKSLPLEVHLKLGQHDKELTNTSRIINQILKLLQNDKLLDVKKLKAFADDKLNVTRMTISLFDKSRKHFSKSRKCWLPAFSPFPTVFSKALLFSFVKSGGSLVKS